MLSIVSLLACVAAVAAVPNPALGVPVATGTSSSVRPNPSQVYINSISYGGTGCPQGSVGSFISDDRQTFTLIFDSYVASIGPTVAATENRKNCQLNLDLQYPSGFQYSIFTTQFRGYAALDKGVQGTQKATYYFSGQPEQVSSSTVFNGPLSTDYSVSDSVPFTSTIWSPCGQALPLNINSQVRLTSSVTGATGLLTDDSIDGHITFVVGIQWQACTK
ncbi:hypothetical protein VE00_07440 [Pseudogymnoascus sp. WSF 3629]|nr:hypothetical protein VE00_07440 [Pseudogymnoascus sp. WSF 3629]